MNFDRVAPHYRWLETVVFGRRLQIARIAFLGKISPPHRVLIVGEGNGRFLAEFVRQYPGAEIDCVEASGRMVALAKKRLTGQRVNFIESDIRGVTLRASRYDLVVTHFFLDCFSSETLSSLIAKLARAATPRAQWLVADFRPPARGFVRLRAQSLIAIMYAFFRVVAGIEAKRLVDYRPWLRRSDFVLTCDKVSPNEMVCSELWRRE